MKLHLGLLVAMLLGCTGSVETSVDGASTSGSTASTGTGSLEPCAILKEPFDSNTAIASVRCAFPTYTKLQFLLSAGSGDLDTAGRSSMWGFSARDDATNLEVNGAVRVSTGLDLNQAGPVQSSCTGEETILLDSGAVVPDAIQRFAQHDPYVGGGTTYFLEQRAPCPDSTVEGKAMVMIYRLPSGEGEPAGTPHRWQVEYDSASKFVKLCGPCATAFGSQQDCAACYD